MTAVGLKTHIWANTTRSLLLLAGFPVLLLALAYAGLLLFQTSSGDTAADAMAALQRMPVIAPLVLAGAGVWYGIAYMGHQAMIDAATGARLVTRRDEPALYNMVENLCMSRGVKTPTIRIIETPELNAYASGLNDKQYSITFTRGLLQALDAEEVEAVAAHELTHILNRDVRVMVIAVVFVGIISFVGEMMFRSMLYGGGRRRESKGSSNGGALVMLAIAIMVVAYVLAMVIRFSLSRRREYLADAGAVELTRNPDAMARALERISGTPNLPIPDELRAMCVENRSASFMGLFATHPPIEKRIDALVRYAGAQTGLASGPPFMASAIVNSAPEGASNPWVDTPWE